MEYKIKVPVLFLIFNRPDETGQVFSRIKRAQPKTLYIAADGPRDGKNGEKEVCEKTREIVSKIDWDCEVKTLYRETNLGCKIAVSSAITWFFENEEMGIILEDDCLPSDSFFRFCEELLILYKNDSRIWHIDGSTFQKLKFETGYEFSKYCLIWGWATWRRAWNNYDPDIKNFPEFERKNIMKSVWYKPEVRKLWLEKFKEVYNAQVDTWDFQWFYTVWINNGMSIRPGVNLIKNIGFNANATHVLSINKLLTEMKNEEILFPLQHPEFFIPNMQLDDECSVRRFGIRRPIKGFAFRLINKIKKIMS